jgi:soluble lytic murein transglycosylase-like protein
MIRTAAVFLSYILPKHYFNISCIFFHTITTYNFKPTAVSGASAPRKTLSPRVHYVVIAETRKLKTLAYVLQRHTVHIKFHERQLRGLNVELQG